MYIRRYFNQFGRTRRTTTAFGEYFIVEFEKIESATNVLAEKEHTLRDEEIKVHSAIEGYVDRKETESITSSSRNLDAITPDPESPSNIINKLNDDCVKEIFKSLSLRDLCAASGTCVQFRENAKFIFKCKFSELKLSGVIGEGESYISIVVRRKDHRLHFEYVRSMNLIENLFENFGTLIKSIDLINVPFSKDIQVQQLIAKYCSGDKSSLTKLFYDGVPHVENEDSLLRLQSVFSRLKHLHIQKLQSGNASTLLIACRELIDLNIEKCTDMNVMNDQTFAQILQSNQQIKRLSSPRITLTEQTLRAIGLYVPQLEYLKGDFYCNENEIEDAKRNLNYLGRLSRLKSLKICYRKDIPVKELINIMVDGNVPIEDLTLHGVGLDANVFDSLTELSQIKRLTVAWLRLRDRNDQLAEAIKKMKSLRFLHVIYFSKHIGIDITRLIQVAATLKELKTCEVYKHDKFIADVHQFRTMAQLVKERGSGVGLKINILRGLCELNVPNCIIEANHQWLQIKNQANQIDYAGQFF